MKHPAPQQHRPGLTDSETFKRLFWPAVWLTLFLLAFATWRLYWKLQLENEKAIVREAGYPASPEELDAWYKKPAGENAADYWIKAREVWKKDEAAENWMPSLAWDMQSGASTYEYTELGMQYPEEVFDHMREYLRKNEEAFRWMDKAASIDSCRWPVDFKKGLTALMPYLFEQKMMARQLDEKMRLAAKDGEWEKFDRLAGIGFKLGGDLSHAPNAIHALCALAVDELMLTRIQEALPFMRLDQALWTRLQDRIAAQRSCQAHILESSWHGETANMLGDEHFDAMVKDISFAALMGGAKPDFGERLKVCAWSALGGEDHDRVKISTGLRQLSDIGQLSETTRLAATRMAKTQWDNNKRPWELACGFLGVMYLLPENHLRSLSRFDAAVTALAAERYRLDTGRLPAKFDDLVPKYLPAIPVDLFDSGKPLKYKIEADRFAVYSVGKNGMDEGGADHTEAQPKADDITFTILLPNAKRGIVPKRKDLPEASK